MAGLASMSTPQRRGAPRRDAPVMGDTHPVRRSARGDRRPGRHRRHRRRRRAALVLVTVGAVAVIALAFSELIGGLTGAGPMLLVDRHADDRPASDQRSAATPEPTGAVTSAPPATSPTPFPSPTQPVLRKPGPVPSAGTGEFSYAAGYGEVLGTSGSLRRYRVAVEQGAETDVAEFAETVDLVLGDPRSWIGSGRVRLQRVPDGAKRDFTVYLATAETARRLCAAGGVDIRVGGRPYTSCRSGPTVVINLDRWQLSVDHFVKAGVPLQTYRAYVINHEVGHALGHGHVECPGRGKLAPTMMKQTLYLDGCVANPWPYPDRQPRADQAL